MPLTDDGFEGRESDNIREMQFNSLATLVDNPNDDEHSFLYALFNANGETLSQNQEQDIEDVYNAGYLEDAEGEDLTKKARELGVHRLEATAATGVITFQREEPAPTNFTIQSETVVRTRGDNPVRFETTESVTLPEGETEVDATIEAVEGGVHGNVSADTITTMPSFPEGIDSVTNKEKVGDPTLTDTDNTPLRRGTEREDDETLRQRTFDSTSIGGAASVTAIESALRELDVQNITVIPNATGEVVDGLDPYSTEVIVYGGALQNIAETLKETMSVTDLLRLQSGVHGEAESYVVESDVIDQEIEVEVSRPISIELQITIDIVHDEGYIGDNETRNRIVEYVGGVKTTGETIMGTGVGVPVYVDKIESYVTNSVDDETGVLGVSNISVDTNGDGDTDTTTDENGLEIIDIQDNEVADISDALFDITVNTTEI